MRIFLACGAFVFVLSFKVLFVSSVGYAEEQKQYALGTWGGLRTELEESGLSFESVLTNDLIGNASGGIRRSAGVLGNFDLTATLDTSTAGWWDNGTVFVYLLGNYGRDPTSYVGDLQASDNIEAYDTFKLYEAWYEHSFIDGALSLLVGLHDYNSEFDALEYAGTLLNSSFGISPDISQVGPSIFSTTAAAARLRVFLFDQWYLQSALYDGIPGDPNDPRGTHVSFGSGEGIFWATEAGLVAPADSRYFKAGVGGWYHSADFEDIRGESRNSNGGLYGIAESMLISEDDQEQGLGVFGQIGFTHGDRNQISRYVGAGFTYQGILPSRDADVFSFGFALARNGYAFRDDNPEFQDQETAFELTYRIEVTPYISVQPDFQYIVNPGTEPARDDAVVLGLRSEVRL